MKTLRVAKAYTFEQIKDAAQKAKLDFEKFTALEAELKEKKSLEAIISNFFDQVYRPIAF